MNEHTMTLTVTAYGKTITITQPDDVDIHEFLDNCKALAMAIEYHPESWDEAILAASDDIMGPTEQKANVSYPYNPFNM